MASRMCMGQTKVARFSWRNQRQDADGSAAARAMGRVYSRNNSRIVCNHCVRSSIPQQCWQGRGGLGGEGNVRRTLLHLILSEKTGIATTESSSKPLEEFIPEIYGERTPG